MLTKLIWWLINCLCLLNNENNYFWVPIEHINYFNPVQPQPNNKKENKTTLERGNKNTSKNKRKLPKLQIKKNNTNYKIKLRLEIIILKSKHLTLWQKKLLFEAHKVHKLKECNSALVYNLQCNLHTLFYKDKNYCHYFSHTILTPNTIQPAERCHIEIPQQPSSNTYPSCSPLSSQQLSFVRLVYGRSWVHFPSGTQNFLGVLLSTHIILIINKPWIQTNTFSIIRFSLRQNFGQPKIRPVETLQNTYFFHSLWQKCLPLQIKRPFPLPHCNVVCSNTTNAHVSC